MKNVLSFRCSKCHVDFSYDEGGKCEKCGKVFCNNHLFKVEVGKKEIFLCENDEGKQKGKRIGSDILRFREKLSKHEF